MCSPHNFFTIQAIYNYIKNQTWDMREGESFFGWYYHKCRTLNLLDFSNFKTMKNKFKKFFLLKKFYE